METIRPYRARGAVGPAVRQLDLLPDERHILDARGWHQDIPAFDGFPYLMVLIASGLHHVTPLPRHLDPQVALDLLGRQVAANRLQACLVLGPTTAFFQHPAGALHRSTLVPRDALIATGRLQPAYAVPPGPELRKREARLEVFLGYRKIRGTLLGDPSKGGRPATLAERARLEGRWPDGVPRGLARCPRCGEWRGECLDPGPELSGWLVRADCPCANDNRCARCGGLLDELRLDSNFFDPDSGQIWHGPASRCLGHRCPDLPPEAPGAPGRPAGRRVP